jgi:hypothetical protein
MFTISTAFQSVKAVLKGLKGKHDTVACLIALLYPCSCLFNSTVNRQLFYPRVEVKWSFYNFWNAHISGTVFQKIYNPMKAYYWTRKDRFTHSEHWYCMKMNTCFVNNVFNYWFCFMSLEETEYNYMKNVLSWPFYIRSNLQNWFLLSFSLTHKIAHFTSAHHDSILLMYTKIPLFCFLVATAYLTENAHWYYKIYSLLLSTHTATITTNTMHRYCNKIFTGDLSLYFISSFLIQVTLISWSASHIVWGKQPNPRKRTGIVACTHIRISRCNTLMCALMLTYMLQHINMRTRVDLQVATHQTRLVHVADNLPP